MLHIFHLPFQVVEVPVITTEDTTNLNLKGTEHMNFHANDQDLGKFLSDSLFFWLVVGQLSPKSCSHWLKRASRSWRKGPALISIKDCVLQDGTTKTHVILRLAIGRDELGFHFRTFKWWETSINCQSCWDCCYACHTWAYKIGAVYYKSVKLHYHIVHPWS